MKHIEYILLMFCNNQFEPIHERIVHAFVRAEACDADSIVGESPLFGEGKSQAWTKDAHAMSGRCQQTRESFGRDCQSADVWCILFGEESDIHG